MDPKLNAVKDDGVKINLDSRYYRKKFPEVDDLVMCLVTDTDESGAHTELIEYNSAKGFIALSDISRKRTKQVKKIMREGKEEILRVIRIDQLKGYIDLSKKNVIKQEEITEFEDKYKKSKTVHGIMKTLAQKLAEDVEILYKEFCWQLYEDFDNAYEAFKQMLSNPDEVFAKIKISDKHKEVLLEILQRRMIPQPVKIRSDFKLTCFTYEGIDAIKFALSEGEKLSTTEIPIKLKIIGAPIYECYTITVKQLEGLNLVNKALKAVENAIKQRSGVFLLNNKAKVLGDVSKDVSEQIDKQLNDNSNDNSVNNDPQVVGIQANIEEDNLNLAEMEVKNKEGEDDN